MREKRGLLVVLLVLVLALSAVQVVAEEGCYLYLDGDESLYCNSVTREEATADCELYGDCDIGTIFIPGECDLEIFPQCEEVKCSVDCSFHKLGVCEELGRTVDESLVGVAVTAEADSFWCDDTHPQMAENGNFTTRFFRNISGRSTSFDYRLDYSTNCWHSMVISF